MRSAASALTRSGSSGSAHVSARAASARAIAERVEQRLELSGTAAARGELAIGEQHVGGAIALAGGDPVPHDFAHARDLIHGAERAVVAGLPGEARALRDRGGRRDQLGGGGGQPLLGIHVELREHVDAHDLVEHDAAVADGVDELARDQRGECRFDVDAGRERADRGRRDGLAQDRERFESGARGRLERGEVPRLRAEPSARVFAAQGERHAAGAGERSIPAVALAERLFEVVPQSGRGVDVEPLQLELGDLCADGGGKRIAPDHDHATERGRTEHERRK